MTLGGRQPRAAAELPRPGPLFGPHPQRPADAPAGAWGRAERLLPSLMGVGEHSTRHRREFERALNSASVLPQLSTAELRAELSRHGFNPCSVARALHHVAQVVRSQDGRDPYPGQLVAAWAMLGHGLVEMDTGEGKSLALLLAAAVAALAGVPVHVVTTNDYLARRDAQAATSVMKALGLRVGAVQAEMDAPQRKAAYDCEVVYASPRELGFDHLRDQLCGAGQRVMRGLCLALIDEADGVLIDHARQPLVLARQASGWMSEAALQGLWHYAGTLRPIFDYELDQLHRSVELLPAALQGLPQDGSDRRLSAQMLRQALVVRHLLQRDRDYLLQDGQIVLVDATTGRIAPGTQWQRGLQHLVALKEGCKVPPHTQNAAQMTLQTLFARYWQLGGASGTLHEAWLELALVYGLSVLRVPPRLPPRRADLGLRLFRSHAWQLAAIEKSARELAARGRPVLIGTGSVAESEALALHLSAAGLPVQVLNARHGDDESERLDRAGQPGVITVTTQMAGRGADIRPQAAALAAGGLHVIRATFNRNARLDRQLLGRCARNGQAGSCEAVLALDSGEMKRCLPVLFATRSSRANPTIVSEGVLWAPVAWGVVWLLQRVLAVFDLYSRCQHLGEDRRARQSLAYANVDVAKSAGRNWG